MKQTPVEWLVDQVDYDQILHPYYINQALEMERENGWQKYPDSKPKQVGIHLVITNGLDMVRFDWWAGDMFIDYSDVIAFLPIPKVNIDI